MSEDEFRMMLHALQALARQIDKQAALGHMALNKHEPIESLLDNQLSKIESFTTQMREIIQSARQ